MKNGLFTIISSGKDHGAGHVNQLKQHQKLIFIKRRFCYQFGGITKELSILNSYHPTERSFSLRFFSKSQLLMRCLLNAFLSDREEPMYRVFEYSQVVLSGFLMHVCDASLQSHELYCDDPNRLLLWLGRHQLQLKSAITCQPNKLWNHELNKFYLPSMNLW